MKNQILLLVFIFCTSIFLFAQKFTPSNGAEICSHRKIQNNQLVDKSFRSGNVLKHAFDVQNYTINIDLVNCLQSPYPNNFNADVKISFNVDSTLNQIVIDAYSTSLIIDSIRLDGVSYTHAENKLTIQLDRTYNPGEQAEVLIYYKHANVNDGAFYAKGGFVFTDCEPEGARKWFPCYDKPSDKATTDITAKVPINSKLGSNGRLQDSIPDGGTIKYHWISRDPVATYLTVITASNNYNLDIVNWTNPNTSEVIPFRFYFNPGENPSYIESIIGNMSAFYSTQFGDHPFEKNGFATLNYEFGWAGMENQTLTSLCPGCWGESLIAHEFAHQWFGDMVTCATWADIFLNEGFTTWAEAHWNENQNGYEAYMNEMQYNAGYYMSNNPGWAISVPSWAVTTPDLNTLFNYAITYMKGSCVMHMLRYTLGDSAFFSALRAYATDTVDFKYKSATIEDFKNKMELESGQELNWFFDQWIYKPNHPVYENVYGIYKGESGKWSVIFTAKQQEQSFIPYFQMPVELKINFKDGTDTLIRVFNSFNFQSFDFEFEKEPVNLVFDPNNNILLKLGGTVFGLNDQNKIKKGFSLCALPNPFNNRTVIGFKIEKPVFATCELFSNTGTKIRTILAEYIFPGEHTVPLNGEYLNSGVYFVVLRTPDHTESVKVIKTE